MPEKSPETWSAATWLLASAMALGGGLINWYSKIKTGHPKAFSVSHFAMDMFASAFVGVGVFMALESWQPMGVCAAAAGVGGHMATRLLFLISKGVESKIQNSTDIRAGDGDTYRMRRDDEDDRLN